MSDYTLADLTRITGAKRRTVQLWAEGGVIRALPGTGHGGKGTHRKFSREETMIACIIHAFARQQMPIGMLLRVSEMLRGGLATPSQNLHDSEGEWLPAFRPLARRWLGEFGTQHCHH